MRERDFGLGHKKNNIYNNNEMGWNGIWVAEK
jgi:hypothetical protein